MERVRHFKSNHKRILDLQFIIILVLTFIVIWLFQGTKGVVYAKSLEKILISEYGWTKSEITRMWSIHWNELNKLKIEGQSTGKIAQHIDQYLSQYKSAFK